MGGAREEERLEGKSTYVESSLGVHHQELRVV